MPGSGPIVHVVGARPNYMKIAPVYRAIEEQHGAEQKLVHTGQHYDRSLKDVFFRELPLPQPHVELEIGSGTHAEQTARALVGLERAFVRLGARLVVVAGDVNSTLAGALAAVKLGIPVCHVESGLRSRDLTMPEEHNRVLTDHLARLLLTHSNDANENLEAEGIVDGVVLIGNTMIDTLLATTEAAERLEAWRDHGVERESYLLVTLHRPALVDDERLLARTMTSLGEVAGSLPVVFPVHPRTAARLEGGKIPTPPGVTLTPPLGYHEFLSLEFGAAAVLTDSGGVQEETTAFGIPCFTLRRNTERPVTVTHGTNTILGLEPDRIAEIPGYLGKARPNSSEPPPLWDGRAGERAAEVILGSL